MFDHFRGLVTQCTPTRVVVECGGVGYALEVPVSTYEAIRGKAAAGTPVVLYSHLSVSQDEFRLFGFATEGERRLFRALITVKGVGPQTARSVLSGCSPSEAVRAIRDGDTRFLDRIRGIGKKTAARVIVELREKAEELLPPVEVEPLATSAADDATRALISLGYHPQIARKAVEKAAQVLGEAATVEGLVKEGLNHVK